MSYTYLRDAAVESSAECFSDIEPFVRSNLSPTAERFYCNVSEMESCQPSLSGMMCEHSTANPGRASWTLLQQDSHASGTRTSGECTAVEASTDGLTPLGLLKKSGLRMFSLRTSQLCFEAFGGQFSETCPAWGMMLDGACFQRAPLVPHTHANDCSAWRTPAASDYRRRNLDWPSVRKPGNPLCLPQQIAQRGYHGYLNPQFSASLMGWPTTWANLRPLETDKFRSWLQLHGML